MRKISFAAALAVCSVPAISTPDFPRDLAKCSVEKNNVARLACYDALVPKAAAQDPAKSSTAVSKWQVQTETSRIDDSKNVYVMLNAEDPIQGWPAKTFLPVLHIRCKERKTDAYIITGMPPTVEYSVDTATVTLRLDKNPAFKVAALKSTDSEALFLPNTVALVKKISTAESMLFQFVPFNSSGQMTTFDVRGLVEAIKPVRAACKW